MCHVAMALRAGRAEYALRPRIRELVTARPVTMIAERIG
jgi:hypothetical protein